MGIGNTVCTAMAGPETTSGGVGLLGIIGLLILIIIIGSSLFWGWAVKKIIQNKGYRVNWFWWGFFFKFLAFIVALTRPDLSRTTGGTDYGFSCGDKQHKESQLVQKQKEEQSVQQLPQMLYCTSCGKQMEVGSKFCRYCGAKTGAGCA